MHNHGINCLFLIGESSEEVGPVLFKVRPPLNFSQLCFACFSGWEIRIILNLRNGEQPGGYDRSKCHSRVAGRCAEARCS